VGKYPNVKTLRSEVLPQAPSPMMTNFLLLLDLAYYTPRIAQRNIKKFQAGELDSRESRCGQRSRVRGLFLERSLSARHHHPHVVAQSREDNFSIVEVADAGEQ
jgi:hypothetical protein